MTKSISTLTSSLLGCTLLTGAAFAGSVAPEGIAAANGIDVQPAQIKQVEVQPAQLNQVEVRPTRLRPSEKEVFAKLELLDYQVFESTDENPNTRPTPAYMFGQADADWVDADILIAEPDKAFGDKAYWLFWDNADEGATRSIEDAFEYVDTDANGKQTFNVTAWRHAVSKTAIPIELAGSISAGIISQEEGVELREQIVWFASPSAPDEYVVASMKVLTASFDITENKKTETVTSVQRLIHPITYVHGDESKGITAEEVARTHAELFTMTGTFKDAFTGIDAGQPGEPLAQSDANTNGNNDDGSSNGSDDPLARIRCALAHVDELGTALEEYTLELNDCSAQGEPVNSWKLAGCCAVGLGLFGANPIGCVVGTGVCFILGGMDDMGDNARCQENARTRLLGSQRRANNAFYDCCLGIENCIPDF